MAMGTRLSVLFSLVSREEGDKVFSLLIREIERLEDILSPFRPDSELSIINARAAVEPVPAEEELFGIINSCKKYHSITGGLFDISLGKVSKAILAGEKRRGIIFGLLQNAGMDRVLIDEQSRKIGFSGKGVELDPGGFAKGYALDRLRDILLQHGIGNVFISFGESSVMALGDHPHGKGWDAGVSDIFSGESLFSLDLQAQTLTTSGISPDNLKKYGQAHILHPREVLTDKSLRHITVLTGSAAEGEVLSTALMLAGEKERQELLSAFSGSKAVEVIYDSNNTAFVKELN